MLLVRFSQFYFFGLLSLHEANKDFYNTTASDSIKALKAKQL